MSGCDGDCKMPVTRGFEKLEMGNGKWQIKGHYVPNMKGKFYEKI